MKVIQSTSPGHTYSLSWDDFLSVQSIPRSLAPNLTACLPIHPQQLPSTPETKPVTRHQDPQETV